MSSPDRRLLLVHAHPDDESIYTGATMARYAAEGALVTLVTLGMAWLVRRIAAAVGLTFEGSLLELLGFARSTRA